VLRMSVAVLLAGACCTSLPRLASKRVAFPARAAATDDVSVTRETWHDAKRDRDVPVTIYAPLAPHAKLPVVVFSHGIGEDRDSYAYLGRALAQHGYLAVHVTHAGTDRAVLERGYRFLYRAVKQKINWINRPLDVRFALDRIAARDDADMTRVAIAGHSAGAFTAFASAGVRFADGSTLRDPRVRVAVAMSMPRMDGVIAPDGYDAIAIPLLNVTGTCDTSLIYRTFPKHRRIPFDSTHATRQYLVTLAHVTHNTFSNATDEHHDAIVALTLAFLDAYLRDDAAARAWFDDAGRGAIARTELDVERK
jgi:predicted dienelactone hydrolase